jgi:hypothetical protein
MDVDLEGDLIIDRVDIILYNYIYKNKYLKLITHFFKINIKKDKDYLY